MRYFQAAFALILTGLFCSAASFAADMPATTASADLPSTQPASDGAMKIYITTVSGLVQVRDAETQPWRAASVHMRISQGAELRTGPHSSVTCVIPPDQTFTLDRLGTVRVEEAALHGKKITTDLIMKYGRTHYDIEGAGLEHEASITSPSSTLAVRGTNVSLFDQPPFKPEATSFTGRAAFTYGRNTIPVGSKGGSTVRALGGTDGAAQTAVNQTVVDPTYAPALTPTDRALFATEVARGAVISFDPVANIPVLTGGRPSFDSELPSALPGALNFVLRWTGPADLNIEVGVDKGDPLTNIINGFQQGEFLYPGFGFQNSPSGGHIAFDHRGGPKGGEEIAYWTGSFPSGLYGIAAQSISGPATSFTFNVIANGVPLNMYYFAADGVTEVKSTQVTHTLAPGQSDTAIVPIPAVPLLEQLIPDDPAGNPNPGITPPATPGLATSTSANLSAKANARLSLPAVQRPIILAPIVRMLGGRSPVH
ncbi:MAG: hypothetical protein M3O30_01140 [Planctomycetota bacterium]|nr:hypothetical protein [Planctomycetota bacterium]